jgi:CheY-like chemotaxis protein
MSRILIAEDDVFSRKVCYKLLEIMGHTPICSPDGKHAYQTLLADNGIDLLITDIMMPEMDGRTLIKTLRGNTSFMKLPVIIMSAVVKFSDINDMLELGANLFLPKPIDKDHLFEYVDRCLK